MLKSEKQLEAEMRALLRKAEILDAQEEGAAARTNAAMICLRNCSAAPADWSGSARPRPSWRRKPQRPRPNKGRDRPRRLSRKQLRQKPVVVLRPASERHAALVAHESGLMMLRSWRSRKPRPQAWNHQPPPQAAIPWQCHIASSPPMRLVTPKFRPRGITASRKEGFAYTDPESHILKGSGAWIQGYNAQAAVDGDHQVIVAIGVSNQPSDAVHLLPMLERIEANTGQRPTALIADAGYCSSSNLEAWEESGLNAYISTSRQQHGHRPRHSRGRPPRDRDARGRMDRKLRSKAGQGIYAMRKTIVEPVFGQIKGARGLDRFLLRGLDKVNGEWALMATTHNILKLFRTSLATT